MWTEYLKQGIADDRRGLHLISIWCFYVSFWKVLLKMKEVPVFTSIHPFSFMLILTRVTGEPESMLAGNPGLVASHSQVFIKYNFQTWTMKTNMNCENKGLEFIPLANSPQNMNRNHDFSFLCVWYIFKKIKVDQYVHMHI